jgi:hypothetical protein
VTAVAPVHVPSWQLSVSVQALPSSQAVPSGWLGLAHTPVAGSHVPGWWHWSGWAHTTGVPLMQAPA